MAQRDPNKSKVNVGSGPMVYIAHEMTPFSPSDVTVFSNCDEVRLTVFEGGEQFTYVKNKAMEFGVQRHTVSGMLLYAATDEEIQPDNSYQMSGNKISVRTLNLNCDFSEIAAQLNAIVDEHFSGISDHL